MAAHNVAAGRDEGIILGLEDETAARGNPAISRDEIRRNGEEFVREFERFRIPVAKVVWQGERMGRYEEVNRDRFGGALTWDASCWSAVSICVPLPTVGSWGSWGSDMALLSRIVDDHDFGVRQVFMGTELAFHSRGYALMWNIAFGPSTPRSRRPQLHYRPELMESIPEEPGGRKISKSVSWGKFLRDIDVPPWRFACGVTDHQVNQARQVLDWNAEDWGGLWTLWYLACWCLNPVPIEEGEIESWKEALKWP